MGPFVLGVLIGWLAEWLFYTFWVKAGDNDGDCSALETELELKNRQITSLQAQLASATDISSNTSKSTAKKASPKAKTSSSKQAASSKTSTAKSSTVAKSKNTITKTSTAKKSTAKKAPIKKVAKTKVGGDDFTKLTGIGPSMAASLKGLGIDTFQKLASQDDDDLRAKLEASGAKMNNNKEAMDSWNEQATVAASGDFAALKKMQEALK